MHNPYLYPTQGYCDAVHGYQELNHVINKVGHHFGQFGQHWQAAMTHYIYITESNGEPRHEAGRIALYLKFYNRIG